MNLANTFLYFQKEKMNLQFLVSTRPKEFEGKGKKKKEDKENIEIKRTFYWTTKCMNLANTFLIVIKLTLVFFYLVLSLFLFYFCVD